MPIAAMLPKVMHQSSSDEYPDELVANDLWPSS